MKLKAKSQISNNNKNVVYVINNNLPKKRKRNKPKPTMNNSTKGNPTEPTSQQQTQSSSITLPDNRFLNSSNLSLKIFSASFCIFSLSLIASLTQVLSVFFNKTPKMFLFKGVSFLIEWLSFWSIVLTLLTWLLSSSSSFILYKIKNNNLKIILIKMFLNTFCDF